MVLIPRFSMQETAYQGGLSSDDPTRVMSRQKEALRCSLGIISHVCTARDFPYQVPESTSDAPHLEMSHFCRIHRKG